MKSSLYCDKIVLAIMILHRQQKERTKTHNGSPIIKEVGEHTFPRTSAGFSIPGQGKTPTGAS